MYTQTTESLGSLGTLHLRNCASNRSSTIFNSGFPMIANFLMEKELHHSESARQKWSFIKIVLFNVLVTTVLSSITNPFTSTLNNKEESDSGLLTSVYGLFFSQLLTTPALQLIDIGGNFARHVFAPRAKTQLEMNMNMKGSDVTLAERYAKFVKFVFLMLWYSAISPEVGLWDPSRCFFFILWIDSELCEPGDALLKLDPKLLRLFGIMSHPPQLSLGSSYRPIFGRVSPMTIFVWMIRASCIQATMPWMEFGI